ncbi:MAG: NnrS family protein, partial [Verrucomicrobiae bacterium]|nr:NnrS family protein [Verrucomicrobiae bacterium]
PLGIVAAIFGLLLWPMHYAGWWVTSPAIQHPRLLIFGFGAAFVFGFLGTAWPRFLEAEALRTWELAALVISWAIAQSVYAFGSIVSGDMTAGCSFLLLLVILGRRLFGRESRDLPPPGFSLAFLSVAMATVVLFCWASGIGAESVRAQLLFRLIAYQGFLLFPLLGVGSYLFGRFFQIPGERPRTSSPKLRALAVWSCGLVILISFGVEAMGWTRSGNALRLLGFLIWATGATPGLWTVRAPNTRAWALRFGLVLIGTTFVCRIFWPMQVFAFEHLLFLGGFSLVILLVADRVILGHCGQPELLQGKSKTWRWIVWLIVLAATTRATADLVPTTRVSHHIYAAITLIAILITWIILHGRRLRQADSDE